MAKSITQLVADLWHFIEEVAPNADADNSPSFFKLQERIREALVGTCPEIGNRNIINIYSLTTNGDDGLCVELFLSETQRNEAFTYVIAAIWDRCYPTKEMPYDPFDAYDQLIDHHLFLDDIECDYHSLDLTSLSHKAGNQ